MRSGRDRTDYAPLASPHVRDLAHLAGTDVRTLQGLMGHEDIETTMIYVHLVESQKHEAARALGAFKKNCHKITTEEVSKIVAISA